MNKMRKFIKEDSGATAVEYGLIIALIAVVIIAAVSMIGKNTSEKYSLVGHTIQASS